MTYIKPEWIVRPQRIARLIPKYTQLDKFVKTTLCFPGNTAMEIGDGVPKYVTLTNPTRGPVMLVQDLGIYETPWGTLLYGKAVAINEKIPTKRVEAHVLGAGLDLKAPDEFMRRLVAPSYVGRFLDIGQLFKGIV